MKPKLDSDFIVLGLMWTIGFFAGVVVTLILAFVSFTTAGLGL